jgi:hypothetical protein
MAVNDGAKVVEGLRDYISGKGDSSDSNGYMGDRLRGNS